MRRALEAIRRKPHHVRVRVLFGLLIAAGILLVAFWIVMRSVGRTGEAAGFFEDIGAGISSSFNNPVYKETFGAPSLGKDE